MRKLTITVIGDALAGIEQYEFCEEAGRMMAELQAIVITGGRGGVMEAISKGVSAGGGLSIGIIPSEDKKDANPYCDVVIPTGLGHARNALTIMASDLVVVVGGQAGTLTEMGFSWIYHKPLLAVTLFGGWAARLAGEKMDQRSNDPVIPIGSIQELKEKIMEVSIKLGIQPG